MSLREWYQNWVEDYDPQEFDMPPHPIDRVALAVMSTIASGVVVGLLVAGVLHLLDVTDPHITGGWFGVGWTSGKFLYMTVRR